MVELLRTLCEVNKKINNNAVYDKKSKQMACFWSHVNAVKMEYFGQEATKLRWGLLKSCLAVYGVKLLIRNNFDLFPI